MLLFLWQNSVSKKLVKHDIVFDYGFHTAVKEKTATMYKSDKLDCNPMLHNISVINDNQPVLWGNNNELGIYF